jgi:transposase
MGATHFLTKGLECVKTEMSLHVLAYNFRRLMKLLGMKTMLSAIRAYARFLRVRKLLTAVFLRASLNVFGRGDGRLKRRLVLHN